MHVYPFDLNEPIYNPWLSNVRKRPGMYVGPVDHNGIHHLLSALLHNLLDNCEDKQSIYASIRIFGQGDFEFFANVIPVNPYLSEPIELPLFYAHLWRQDKSDYPVIAIINDLRIMAREAAPSILVERSTSRPGHLEIAPARALAQPRARRRACSFASAGRRGRHHWHRPRP